MVDKSNTVQSQKVSLSSLNFICVHKAEVCISASCLASFMTVETMERLEMFLENDSFALFQTSVRGGDELRPGSTYFSLTIKKARQLAQMKMSVL